MPLSQSESIQQDRVLHQINAALSILITFYFEVVTWNTTSVICGRTQLVQVGGRVVCSKMSISMTARTQPRTTHVLYDLLFSTIRKSTSVKTRNIAVLHFSKMKGNMNTFGISILFSMSRYNFSSGIWAHSRFRWAIQKSGGILGSRFYSSIYYFILCRCDH